MSTYIHRGLGLIFISVILFMPSSPEAADMVWQLSKQDAMNLAQQQGKKILLLAGREI